MLLVSPAPFVSQKQLTQDDDSSEVEIAIDNTAFMDEFFSEVGTYGAFFWMYIRKQLPYKDKTSDLVSVAEESQSFAGVGWPDQEVTRRVSPTLNLRGCRFLILWRKSAISKLYIIKVLCDMTTF